MPEIDVMVVPSLWNENSPLVIHEAFLARVPVIASRCGGVTELIQHELNGLLFERGNADDLRRAIENVIQSPQLLENSGRIFHESKQYKKILKRLSIFIMY